MKNTLLMTLLISATLTAFSSRAQAQAPTDLLNCELGGFAGLSTIEISPESKKIRVEIVAKDGGDYSLPFDRSEFDAGVIDLSPFNIFNDTVDPKLVRSSHGVWSYASKTDGSQACQCCPDSVL